MSKFTKSLSVFMAGLGMVGAKSQAFQQAPERPFLDASDPISLRPLNQASDNLYAAHRSHSSHSSHRSSSSSYSAPSRSPSVPSRSVYNSSTVTSQPVDPGRPATVTPLSKDIEPFDAKQEELIKRTPSQIQSAPSSNVDNSSTGTSRPADSGRSVTMKHSGEDIAPSDAKQRRADSSHGSSNSSYSSPDRSRSAPSSSVYNSSTVTSQPVYPKRPATVKPSNRDIDPSDVKLVELVKRVQMGLLIKGYTPGMIDGIMGARTRIALKQFQKDFGLNSDGLMETGTLNALGVVVPR